MTVPCDVHVQIAGAKADAKDSIMDKLSADKHGSRHLKTFGFFSRGEDSSAASSATASTVAAVKTDTETTTMTGFVVCGC